MWAENSNNFLFSLRKLYIISTELGYIFVGDFSALSIFRTESRFHFGGC